MKLISILLGIITLPSYADAMNTPFFVKNVCREHSAETGHVCHSSVSDEALLCNAFNGCFREKKN